MLEEHPMMHHGACMVSLIKMPPSKHVLKQSTPLISKIKNKLRSINELKYKFREFFKALKTNVSRKYFPTTFMLVLPILFAFIIVESKLFPARSWGGLGSNFGSTREIFE
jgi:hypothetical protein